MKRLLPLCCDPTLYPTYFARVIRAVFLVTFSCCVRYHAVYVKEVKRIFDTYKTRLPDYKDKKIIIET